MLRPPRLHRCTDLKPRSGEIKPALFLLTELAVPLQNLRRLCLHHILQPHRHSRTVQRQQVGICGDELVARLFFLSFFLSFTFASEKDQQTTLISSSRRNVCLWDTLIPSSNTMVHGKKSSFSTSFPPLHQTVGCDPVPRFPLLPLHPPHQHSPAMRMGPLCCSTLLNSSC